METEPLGIGTSATPLSLQHLAKETDMTASTQNFYENPMAAMGGMGGGTAAGGAALGGLVGAAFGSGGFGGFGNRNVGEGFVTPTQLQTAMSSVIDANNSANVQEALGDIKGLIPAAEGQVQLALAGAVGEIRSHLGQVENGITAGQAAINKNVSDAIASSLASQNAINVNVLQSAAATREAINLNGQANLLATKEAATATALAVANSTKEIIAALNDQNMQNLQRQLTVAETALAEQRAEGRTRASEINVTQTVTQNQNQLQMQAQQQQQFILLNNLANIVGGLQTAVATNSNLIVGNTGAVATGPQTANPVNVRA